jgi:anti-sigma B factor antagonist
MLNEFTVELVPCPVAEASIIRPVGSIDATAAPVLESHFKSLHEQNTKKIVVDFSKADFISSAGIGIFLGSVTMLREAGGDILFMNVPRHISEVFDVINLQSFFVTIDSVDQIENAVWK